MRERPDPNDPPGDAAKGGDEPEVDEAYSDDEEAAVAARLEDLGYI
jgi:hypothetical protein